MFGTFYLGRTHVVDMHNAFIIHCMEVSSRSCGPTVPVQCIICCLRRGMMQLHILSGMKAEAITASVAMCI
jgi:hypothetical protein